MQWDIPDSLTLGLPIGGVMKKSGPGPSDTNQCAMLRCWACCINTRLRISGREARAFSEALVQQGVVFGVVAGGSLSHIVEEDAWVVFQIPRQRDRMGRPKAPSLDQVGPRQRVEAVINGPCPFLVEREDGGKDCGLYGDPRRPSACDNFKFDPDNPTSACAAKRSEEGFDGGFR